MSCAESFCFFVPKSHLSDSVRCSEVFKHAIPPTPMLIHIFKSLLFLPSRMMKTLSRLPTSLRLDDVMALFPLSTPVKNISCFLGHFECPRIILATVLFFVGSACDQVIM